MIICCYIIITCLFWNVILIMVKLYCFLSVSLLFVIIIISTHLMSLSLKWHVSYFHEYVLLITLCFIRSLLIFHGFCFVDGKIDTSLKTGNQETEAEIKATWDAIEKGVHNNKLICPVLQCYLLCRYFMCCLSLSLTQDC